jgi:hypothetical protein
MPISQKYSFYPDIGNRRYSSIADQVSILAMHVFDLMRENRDSAPFSFEQIEQIIRDAGHVLSVSALRECLLELEQAKCLVVAR